MLLKINNTDYSAYITGYEIQDDQNVLLKTIQNASGGITQVYAPYTRTTIKTRLRLTQSQIQALYTGLSLSNTVVYYSAKTGSTKTALFSYEDNGYKLKRKTARAEFYDEITLTFTKVGEVTP